MTTLITSLHRKQGESLEIRQRVLAGYAMQHDLTVAHTFVEGRVTASKPLADRPEGAALLAILKPGDVVITPRLDRVFRSALDALDVLGKLKAKGTSATALRIVNTNGLTPLVVTSPPRSRASGSPRSRSIRRPAASSWVATRRLVGAARVTTSFRFLSSRRRSRGCGRCVLRVSLCVRSAIGWRRRA